MEGCCACSRHRGHLFQNGLTPGERVSLDELRKDFTSGGFKVMGEIGLQYEGLSPSDMSVDSYFRSC